MPPKSGRFELALAALLIAAAAIPAPGRAGGPPGVQMDTDGDTLPDLLERRAGLRPKTPDLLSYVDVGDTACLDRRPAVKVRSPKRPWCSLERAAEAAPAGATVLVRAGVYARFTARRAAKRKVRMRAYPSTDPSTPGA